MAKVIELLHGGKIRYSAKIASSESTIWDPGLVLSPDSAGELVVATTTAGIIKGMVNQSRDDLSQTGPTANSLVGTPTGERASIILDEAVVKTDQISGNLLLAVNDTLYVDASGKITTTAVGDVVGEVLQGNTSVGGKATILWTVQY